MTRSEYNQLIRHLRNDNDLKYILDLMKWVESNHCQSLSKVQRLYCADFCRALSTGEPIYLLCPSQLCDILIAGKQSVLNNVSIIRDQSPLIYIFTFELGVNFADWYFNLLSSLGKKSKNVINIRKNKVGNNGYWEEREPTDEQQQIWKQWWKHGTCFYGKAKRQMPKFDTDIKRNKYQENKKKKKKNSKSKSKSKTKTKTITKNNSNDNSNSNNDGNNYNDAPFGARLHNKYYSDDPGLTTDTSDDNWEELIDGVEEKTSCDKKFAEQNGRPAMMIFRCAAHSICIGRHVITKSESVRDMFAFLVLFYLIMPVILIADYMCNMIAFSFNRAPGLFEKVLAAIDVIHGETHVGCSNALSMKIKKQWIPQWRRLQDEGVEQRHTILNRFRLMGVWMRMDSFMLVTAVMVEIDNRRILQKYSPKGIHRTASVILDRSNPRSWADQYNEFNTVSNNIDKKYEKESKIDDIVSNANDDNNSENGDANGSGNSNEPVDWYDRLFNQNWVDTDAEDELEFEPSDTEDEDDLGRLLRRVREVWSSDDDGDSDCKSNQ